MTAAVVPLGVGAAVLFADWPSAVIIALTVPLLPVFAILVGKYTADRTAAATDAVHRLSGHLLELVRALPVLGAFRRAEAQAEAVRRVSERHRRATLKTLRTAFSSAFVLELAATLSVTSGSVPMRLFPARFPNAALRPRCAMRCARPHGRGRGRCTAGNGSPTTMRGCSSIWRTRRFAPMARIVVRAPQNKSVAAVTIEC